jgi:hypothetical protein
MGEPSWRFIKEIPVPERPGVFWTPALDYVTPGRLYRIAVEPTAGPPVALHLDRPGKSLYVRDDYHPGF